MKKKNLALIALAAITATATLSGCNNDAKPVETTSGEPAATSTIDIDKEDREIVEAAKSALTVTSTATTDFTLTVSAAGGASIAWTSNNAAITINGTTAKVTRPGFGQQDVTVTLTATIVSGNITDTKTFEVTVSAIEDESETVAELKAKDKDAEVYAHGVVTGFLYGNTTADPTESKKGFYLTDGTDTIYVDDSAAAEELEDNQEVYFAAIVDEDSGAKQLKSVTELAILADDATPDFSYATVLKTDAELKAAIDLGADAVGKTYEFLAQVYCNAYGSYSVEPIDYENNKASWGVYFAGSSSLSLQEYGKELKGKEVVRVVFYVNSTNSSNKGRGNILAVKPLTEADKKASIGLVLGNAVKLNGLYTEDTTIALPTKIEGYEDFDINWALEAPATGVEIVEDAETHAKSLQLTASADITAFKLVGTTSYETEELVYTAATGLTEWAADTTYYTRSGEEGAYTYIAVDQATVTTPADGVTYYTAALETVTKNVTVTDQASVILLSAITFQDITAGIEGKVKNDMVYLSGVITKIEKDNDGKVKNVFVNDGTTEFEIYNGLVDTSVIASSDLVVGKYISFLGTYDIYNGMPESKETNVIKMEDATDAQKAAVTATEFAFEDGYFNNVTDQALATKGTVFENATIVWSVTSGTTATITDNKLTITRGAADEEVTIKATITVGEQVKEVNFTFTVYNVNKHLIVAKYSGATTNMDDTDQATKLGLPDAIFKVIGTKNDSSTNVGLNKDGTIRLYGIKNQPTKAGTTLTISLESGASYAIDTIIVNFGGTVNQVKINGGEAQNVTKNSSLEVDMTGLTSFSIQHANPNNTQVYITSIEIIYHSVSE